MQKIVLRLNIFYTDSKSRVVDVHTEVLLTESDLSVVCLTSGVVGEGGSLWMVPLLMCQ